MYVMLAKCVVLAPWFFEFGKLQWSHVENAKAVGPVKPENVVLATTWLFVKPLTILHGQRLCEQNQGTGQVALIERLLSMLR